MATEKSIKPANLVPRSFGGEKNNFSDDLIANGYEVNAPQTYNGDNLNYQLDATGKELDYCEKVVDYINGLGVGKTPIVNANNKLDETQVGLKVYSATETYSLGEWVKGTVNDVIGLYESLKPTNVGNELTDTTSWKKVKLGDEGANVDLSNLSTTGQAKFDEKVDLNFNNMNPSQTAKNTIVGWGMPDYSAGVNKGLTFTSDSYYRMYVWGRQGGQISGALGVTIKINDITFKDLGLNYGATGYVIFDIKPSDNVKITYTTTSCEAICYPFIGVTI